MGNVGVGERSKFQWRSILALMLYVLAMVWLAVGFIYDVLGYPDSEVDLFPRSGAILVLVAFWLTMVIRPKVEAAEYAGLPSYKDMREAPEGVTFPTLNPAVTNRLSRKLAWREVVLGTCGTFIWAYGDLIVDYVAPRM